MTLKQGKTVLSCNHTDIGVTHQCCKAGGAVLVADVDGKIPVGLDLEILCHPGVNKVAHAGKGAVGVDSFARLWVTAA